MDNQLYTLKNNIIKTVIKYAIVAVILMIILFSKNYSIALGLAFGCIVSLINFSIMIHCIDNLFNGDVKSRYYYTFFYLVRLLTSSFAILYAIKLESLSLTTTIIGLLSIKIVLTLGAIFKTEKKCKKSYISTI